MSAVLRVGAPTIEETHGRAVWSASIHHPSLPEKLWYSVPADYVEFFSNRLDAALVALTIPALHLGSEIHLDGAVTDELIHHHAELQSLQVLLGHGSQPVMVHAEGKRPGTLAPRVATGFSAGVDSFAVLAQHFFADDIPPSQALTHLLFNNVGSHYGKDAREAGDASSDEALPAQRALWRARFRQALEVAQGIGLPLIDVDTNVMQMFPPETATFEQSHTLRNASVAYVLSKAIGTWHYASGLHYRQIRVEKHHRYAAYSDPFTLPLISSSALITRASGTDLRRVDKTRIIGSLPEAQEHLDVCTRATDGSNCSACRKCLRTLATLEILGLTEDYSRRFDLNQWRSERPSYFARVLAFQSDPYFSEIISLASELGYHFPSSSYSRARLMRLRSLLARPLRLIQKLGWA